MNIRDLHYFINVSRLLHFGKAAEACHVSQPTLSSQIKKLEDELGVSLFERNNRGVRLTEVGKELLSSAESALAQIEQMKIIAQSAQDPLAGTLRIGAIPTIAPYVIPDLFEVTKSELPNLKLIFNEDITERLLQQLREGGIDAALIATLPEDQKFDYIDLYDEPFWVIFPERHALHRRNSISASDLPRDELLLLGEGHCFADQSIDLCALGPADFSQIVRASSLEMLVKMVSIGQGITLVPATAIDGVAQMKPLFKAEKLKDKNAQRRVNLVFRSTYPRKALLDRIAHSIRNIIEKTNHVTILKKP